MGSSIHQLGSLGISAWKQVAGGQSLPGAAVTSVSRSDGFLDIFVVGLDARVWTAAWQPSDRANGYRGWWPIGTLVSGMTDPEVCRWYEAGQAYRSENTAYSEEGPMTEHSGTLSQTARKRFVR